MGRLILPVVATERSQGSRDIFDHALDPELLGEHPAEPKRVAGRVALRHEEPDDPLALERPSAQGGYHGAVDPARDPDDGPATAQVTKDNAANGRLNLLGNLPGVDPKHFS
jgi:hypothetical protein